MTSVEHIRLAFADLLCNGDFVTDKTGVRTLELVGASFVADHDTIFGEPNEDYIRREINWYTSQSLYIKDMEEPVPAIWRMIADQYGHINSNYGWCLFSPDNGLQFEHVEKELRKNPNSRRAVAIYTRPTMHTEYCSGGMSDFICTNAVQYLIRRDRLDVVVQMRSNDVTFGFRNDYAWQSHVQHLIASQLGILIGDVYWQVGSLHVYDRDFYLVDHFAKTGEWEISKADYRATYVDDPTAYMP